MNIRHPNTSSAAVILRQSLTAMGMNVTHSQALELVAKTKGYQSHQALAADEKAMRGFEKPVLVQEHPQECGNDYVYTGPDNTGVWIRVRNITVYVKSDDEGVVVDLFAHGCEDEASETSTYLHYQDAASVLIERVGEGMDASNKAVRDLCVERKVQVSQLADGQWTWAHTGKSASVTFASADAAYLDAFETQITELRQAHLQGVRFSSK